jgi:hypothetical protein
VIGVARPPLKLLRFLLLLLLFLKLIGLNPNLFFFFFSFLSTTGKKTKQHQGTLKERKIHSKTGRNSRTKKTKRGGNAARGKSSRDSICYIAGTEVCTSIDITN